MLGLFLVSIVIILLHAKYYRCPSKLIVFVFSVTFIFIFSLFVSVANNNVLSYIIYDSAGFPIYFVLMPTLLFVLNSSKRMGIFLDYYVKFSFIFSLVSLLIFIVFFLVFKELNLDTITHANNTLKQYINLKLGATAGILRVNTNAIQMVLPAIFLVLIKNSKCWKDYVVIATMVIAIFADGHRAVIISLAIIILAYLLLYKRHAVMFSLLLILLTVVAVKYDSIVSRFNFDTESSSLRLDQIPPLISEIDNSPLLGSGFGSSASLIRNELRPFMYEVDVLAIAMKLGVPLALFFGLSWFLLLPKGIHSNLASHNLMIVTMLACAFYMTTNGGYFMSPITSVLQMMLYLVFASFLNSTKIYGINRC
ncbi:O-antigen ligase family protein [Vibrio breoganii]